MCAVMPRSPGGVRSMKTEGGAFHDMQECPVPATDGACLNRVSRSIDELPY